MIIAAGGLRGPDYFILVGYFGLMLAIGVYFWRYMTNMREYFSGRNQIPWWLSGISYYMTSFSAFTFVASSELAHRHGFVAVTLTWVVIPTTIIGALVFSWRWRRARIDSPVEYLEERFGLGMRQTISWVTIPIRLIDNGLRLYATGLFLSGVVGLDLRTSIISTALITLAYTFAGGLWAVTVTDFVQFIVMMAGVIVLLVLSLGKIGGVSGLIHGSPAGFFSLTAPPTYTWSYMAGWFVLLVCNYNISFSLVQRYYSVRDERAAKRVGLMVAAVTCVGPLLFFAPAMAARQFLPDADSKNIYAILCVTLLPTGALGLIIAAMFSATMSTLSGEYNALASVVTNDIYRRLIHPDASEKRLVKVGRLATIGLGVVPMAIALYVASSIGNDVLFRKMTLMFSVAIAPIAVPMLAGLLWRRCTNAGAIAGLLAGLTAGLTLYFYGYLERELTFATLLTTLIVITGVSLLWPASPEEKQRSEGFAAKLRTPIGPEEVPSIRGVPSPWRAVGGTLIATALLLIAVVPMMPWGTGARTNLMIGLGLLVAGVLMLITSKRSPIAVTAPSLSASPPEEVSRAEAGSDSNFVP